ncbi:MAG: FAD-dependent oxidoreductase, partial [Thermoguttaceae bacterium]
AEGADNVLWPMEEGRCRWSFQLLDYAVPELTRKKERLSVQLGEGRYPVLSEESFGRLLGERAPWFDAKVEEVPWRIAVRFERRLASRFGSGRAWLVGDAGHVTGPVGMQSMNVGFREAVELAAIVAGTLQEGQSPDRLEAYGRGRVEEWNRLLRLEEAFRADDSAPAWVRDHAGQLAACLPAAGEELEGLASQLGLRSA